MTRQFRDAAGATWIASNFGSTSLGSVAAGLPIDPGRLDLDQIGMQRLGDTRTILATLPAGRWWSVTDDELRDALARALIVYGDSRTA